VKKLNDEILMMEGKGSEQMVGSKKADEIEIVMSSIKVSPLISLTAMNMNPQKAF